MTNLVAILLTGATNYEIASEFVLKGGAFRLLNKPCPPAELIENIESALLHYNQMIANDHTLGEIMNSVVRSFTSVLAAALPLYFGRSQRVMRMSTEIAKSGIEVNMEAGSGLCFFSSRLCHFLYLGCSIASLSK